MKQKAILLISFLGLAVLVYYVYTSLGKNSPPVAVAQTPVPTPAPTPSAAKKPKTSTVPADYSWAELSKQDRQ